MRQLFVPKSWIDPQNNQVVLVDDPFHHLIHVLRKKRGQWVEAFDGQGGAYRAQILEIMPDKAILAFGERKLLPQMENYQLTLGVAILKGKQMNWMVQKVTELGVGTIVPLLTRRTISRRSDHVPTKTAKWEKIAIEAAEQCGRIYVPNIHHPIRLEDFFSQIGDFDAKLLAWEGQAGVKKASGLREWASHAIPVLKNLGRQVSILLLIGPEGGFARQEVELAEGVGFIPFGLGRNILRSETAALIASALLMVELENLS